MAIISSVALGKAQKSLGNVTFQHYFGKTVAKQKVVRNPNYKPSTKQELQRARMYFAFKFANAWDGLSDMLFVRSKWGTKRNNFLKLNYPTFADYVNEHENLIIPQSGHFVNLLYRMITDFGTYSKPVFIAKGIDAALTIKITLEQYSAGATSLAWEATVVDALYTKMKIRILYATTDVVTAPYDGPAPLQATAWNDMTLSNGIWTSPALSLNIAHTTNLIGAFVFQVMIDDMPCTINALGYSFGSLTQPACVTTLNIS